VRYYGDAPSDYATDVLGAQALRFVQTAPAAQPWFLYFSPNAPHLPWVPSPAHAGAFDGVQPPIPDLATMNDVRGKPSYVRDLLPKTPADRAAYIRDDRNERAMLLSVDAWFQQIVGAIAARGELDNTVIIFMGDNGYTFGLHRLDGKRYPYTPSVQVPFAIRTPWAPASTIGQPVSNVDVAGTISALAGVTPGLQQMGIDLGPAIRGDPLPARPGVFLDWGGDVTAPAWQGVQTTDGTYVRNADGSQELYRSADAWQLHNVVDTAGARSLARRDRSLLAVMGAEAQG
jgi:arylsulfatase A-like enzyme